MHMKKQYDVVALGELLIDFTENGFSEQGNPILEVNPGGAPCNVLAMLQKLGHKTAFIGKVGNDQFGRFLKNKIKRCGISADNLVMSFSENTTLTFVETKADGDREFSFYRKPGADMMLTEDDINYDIINKAKVFHFGTLSMTHEYCRNATKASVEFAKKKGLLITFDPNYRAPLWDSESLAREQIDYGLSQCDAVKIADNELEFITNETSVEKAVDLIREKYDIPFICVTLGRDGCIVYYKNIEIRQEAYLQEKTIETTGAGDAFCANSLNYILEHGMEELTEENLKELLTFANAAASIVTTKKGALMSMPEKKQILDFLSNMK